MPALNRSRKPISILPPSALEGNFFTVGVAPSGSMLSRSYAILLALAISLGRVHGHSGMTRPQPFSPSTCRVGDGATCEGPCDVSSFEYAGSNFYPPGVPWPEWDTPNPRTAATYQRGQQVSIASSRNNHPPVRFEDARDLQSQWRRLPIVRGPNTFLHTFFLPF